MGLSHYWRPPTIIESAWGMIWTGLTWFFPFYLTALITLLANERELGTLFGMGLVFGLPGGFFIQRGISYLITEYNKGARGKELYRNAGFEVIISFLILAAYLLLGKGLLSSGIR